MLAIRTRAPCSVLANPLVADAPAREAVEAEKMAHKFRIGETVYYRPAARGLQFARGTYEVMGHLPEKDGELEYRIKHIDQPHARVARESELSAAT
jgi:hypothetical protein